MIGITAPQTKTVVIIGIDGVGNFCRDNECPNIQKLINNGSGTWSGKAQYPTDSAENWGSIFHGVSPAKHKLDLQKVESVPYSGEYPSIFKLVKQKYPSDTTASFVTWKGLDVGIIEHSVLDVKWFEHQKDEHMKDAAITFINNNNANDVRLLFVYFGDPDEVGHQNGYESEEYKIQLKLTDTYVGEVLQALHNWKDTYIIMTTDHGAFGKQHGGDSDVEMTVMWGLQIPKYTLRERETLLDRDMEITNMDTAATALAILGIDIPDYFDSKSWY